MRQVPGDVRASDHCSVVSLHSLVSGRGSYSKNLRIIGQHCEEAGNEAGAGTSAARCTVSGTARGLGFMMNGPHVHYYDTDALKMREAPMSALTKPEIQKFKKQLSDQGMALRKAIHASLLNSDNKTYAEVAGRVLDIGEQSMADLLADFHIITLEKEVAELADVEAAVVRIASGTYGQCADCGADIAVERLRINPAAKRCTECQVHHERMAKDMTPSL